MLKKKDGIAPLSTVHCIALFFISKERNIINGFIYHLKYPIKIQIHNMFA
jgi:hypothetical protein